MSRRWPGCVKIHADCGGHAYWVEAVRRPGVGYHGECLECGEGLLAVEDIIPVELPDDVRQAREHEYWGDRRLKVWRDLSWDDDADWEANQEQIQERLSA